jgi:Ca2+-transporting ATPase
MDSSKTPPHVPWSLSPDELFASLQTAERGLTYDEARKRFETYGANSLPTGRKTNALAIFFHQFASPLIFILLGASLLTSALQEWLDTGVILLAIAVNVILGFYQEFRADRALEKLTSYIRERARVVRDGIQEEIDSSSLALGDIVAVSSGSRAPADCRIISANGIEMDESILTGESLPVPKSADVVPPAAILSDRANMLHAGTLAVAGHATAVVTSIGAATEIGKIARLVGETGREETPLQKSLWRLAWIIFGFTLLLIAGLVYLGVHRGEPLLEMLVISAAVAVGSIPEALPIALTVILAVGVERLAVKKGVIRNLSAAETLGSATVIMTDKTGTLTEANMRLVGIMPIEELLKESSHDAAFKMERLTPEKKKILEAALLGTDAAIVNPSAPRKEWEFSGRPFESNIARAANSHGIDVLEAAKTRLSLLDFNSTNKFSVSRNTGTGEVAVIGAPDILLSRSALSKDEYVALEERIHAISADGGRILGVAYLSKKDGAKLEAGKTAPADVAALTFAGLLVFSDPVRKEAPAALQRIEELGARVVMVTGDLKGTAMSVAKELGWSVTDAHVVSGEDLHRMTDAELAEVLPRIRIFARVTPEDKLRIGKLFQAKGEVVAMTGDGVNDAPSLKAIDIGVALGSGSDVAKSVADLILLDDNFKTIVAAIEEGRRILGNIRKAFVYLMSNALDEVFLIGGALLVGLPLPLTALQIIWVNLFTGSLPALSFAFDDNHDHGKTGRKTVGAIFNTEVKVLTVGIGVITSALLFVLYWALLEYGVALEDARSILFVCFASYMLVAAYSLRSLEKPVFAFPVLSNKVLNWSVLVAVAILIVTVTLPAFKDAFLIGTPPTDLLWVIAVWLTANVALIELSKWALRFYKNRMVPSVS